mgnify:CR=1 FL=1
MRTLSSELEEDFEIKDPAEELFRACEKVVRAGVWLIRNGYGRLAILPYLSPSGRNAGAEVRVRQAKPRLLRIVIEGRPGIMKNSPKIAYSSELKSEF